MAKQFPYPPCAINWQTEKPYLKHKFEIVPGILLVRRDKDEEVFYYHIRCSRCGFNDPSLVPH